MDGYGDSGNPPLNHLDGALPDQGLSSGALWIAATDEEAVEVSRPEIAVDYGREQILGCVVGHGTTLARGRGNDIRCALRSAARTARHRGRSRHVDACES